jgi:hypothetical protein
MVAGRAGNVSVAAPLRSEHLGRDKPASIFAWNQGRRLKALREQAVAGAASAAMFHHHPSAAVRVMLR